MDLKFRYLFHNEQLIHGKLHLFFNKIFSILSIDIAASSLNLKTKQFFFYFFAYGYKSISINTICEY